MRKTLIITASLLALLTAGCTKKSSDNTSGYLPAITVSPVQEAFAEDITANWCGSCGTWGIPWFEAEVKTNPKRINAISVHASSRDTMYCQAAGDILAYYESFPSGNSQTFFGW